MNHHRHTLSVPTSGSSTTARGRSLSTVRGAILASAALALGACATGARGVGTATTALPAHEGLTHALGAKKADVLADFGEPDLQGERVMGPGSFVTYKRHGLVYDFDEDNHVVAIRFRTWREHTPFGGRVHGVGLDDTIDQCIEAWGEPVRRSRPIHYFPYEDVEWRAGDTVLELEIWVAGGLASEADGREPAGHVKFIELRRSD